MSFTEDHECYRIAQRGLDYLYNSQILHYRNTSSAADFGHHGVPYPYVQWEIHINTSPHRYGDWRKTLIHEAAHAAGYEHDEIISDNNESTLGLEERCTLDQ